MDGACGTYGGQKYACRISVRIAGGKRSHVRPRLRRGDNLKIDLVEIALEDVD
jgi:hypothetical protein